MSERRLVFSFLLLVPILYVNGLGGDFVCDDIFLVRDNPYLDGFSNFVSYFTSGTRELGGRPVRLASLYLDTLIFGKNPMGYHISNILHYMLLSVLVYAFATRLLPDRFTAAALTWLFIAHPLHTEAVSYISGRKDVLGCIFSFASLLCFDRYIDSKKNRDVLLTLLFFFLAIGTKEIYAVLPLLYLAVTLYRGKGFENQRIFYLGLLTTVALFVLYVLFVRNEVFFDYTHIIPVYGDNKGVNIPTAMKICAVILQLSCFPFSLSADYTFNVVKRISFSDPIFFISAGILFLMGLGAFLLRKKQKTLSLGLVWLLICLAPVCQLIPYPEIISERSLMLLSFGSCLILSTLISQLPRRWSPGCLLVVLILLSALTTRRNMDWRDELTLWRSATKVYPECARAQYNLGVALTSTGDLESAQKAFQASLDINPPELMTVPDYSFDSLLNLGNIHAVKGDFETAKRSYEAVLRYKPKSRLALENLRALEEWREKTKEQSP